MTNQQNILARTSFSKIDFLITNSNIPIRKKMIRIQFTEKNFMVQMYEKIPNLIDLHMKYTNQNYTEIPFLHMSLTYISLDKSLEELALSDGLSRNVNCFNFYRGSNF